MDKDLNKYSKTITQDDTQPGAQAMLHAIGLDTEDLKKAQVGIASTGWQGNPCNMHLNFLASQIKREVDLQSLVGLIFHTIGVSDGISMGTKGMRFSLPSRDIIADSIETVMNAQWYDGLLTVVGCDKNMPGAMMAIGRLNRPAILVYGGTIAPGNYKGQDLDIVSAFEALGKKTAGEIAQEEFKAIVKNACPGAGACGGMYTANTMASSIEALGMSLPFNSSLPAASIEKADEAARAAVAIKHLMEQNILPSDILTKASFENALRIIMVLGGSTNAVLHMIAMAKAAKVELNIDDFQRISDETPFLSDLKPSGKYVMEDLHKIGGVPAVMKYMLKNDLLDGSCLTVTGKTVEENLADVPDLKEAQQIIHPTSSPLKASGHLQILYGNLAKDGCVAKITGKEGLVFSGPAKVFNSEPETNEAILKNEIKEGEVIVIRYSGPKGAPGMPEMLKPTSLIMGAGLGKKVALITDGRFSGGTHGFVVGHICPEAETGGMLAFIKNGDLITIDADNNKLTVDITDEELVKRKAAWEKPEKTFTNGILKKYYHTVSSASEGCVTDEF